MTVREMASQPGAPSERTLHRWKHDARISHEERQPPHKRGRPSKLSWGENLVIGGWVLERDALHEITTPPNIADFVNESFGICTSPSTVSRLMHRVGLSSHAIKPRDSKYIRKGLDVELFNFLLKFRKETERVEPSRIVCVDVTNFGSYSHHLRTYSPIGS